MASRAGLGVVSQGLPVEEASASLPAEEASASASRCEDAKRSKQLNEAETVEDGCL